MSKAMLMFVLALCLLTVVVLLIGSWQLSAARKSKVAISGGDQYRQLAEEYRRLAELAITAQEHTDLKLGDVSTRISQLGDQLESVQRILADVE